MPATSHLLFINNTVSEGNGLRNAERLKPLDKTAA